MRLRLTIQRHGLPETPIIWVVDTKSNPTIAQLLEQVNEAIPIEAGEWGFEDYAVEVKGTNGVNYECLHYQLVKTVMKEEDEVIIRPLLTQDIKIRRISGRIQISADGKHLVDGLAFGRPLLRRPVDRPDIKIPPRKKRRITYNEDEEDDEGFAALNDKEAEDSGNDDNRQLLLHANFEDDSEGDDEDFAPGENEGDDSEEEVETEDKEIVGEDDEEHQELISESQDDVDTDRLALADVPDEETRAKIRKLRSAFPRSPLAVCKYVFNGSEGDMGEAYEAMTHGFRSTKSKSAITEILEEEENLGVPKTRSRSKKTPKGKLNEELQGRNSIKAVIKTGNLSFVAYHNQNGLPPGSIESGKALSFIANATDSSSSRRRTDSRHPNSALGNENVRFALDEGLSEGLTATPIIDLELNEDDATSSSGSSDSSEEMEEAPDNMDVSDSSSSESHSDSSSDSSSDDESPEETSSKPSPAQVEADNSGQPPTPTYLSTKPCKGQAATRARNRRRHISNILRRFKEKGILPAGTTLAEFRNLNGIHSGTPPEGALATLEAVRESKLSDDGSAKFTSRALAKPNEFELRRQELLASLASSGIEVGPKSPNEPSAPISGKVSVVESAPVETTASPKINTSQAANNTFSTVLKTQKTTSKSNQMDIDKLDEDLRPSTATDASAIDNPSSPPKSQNTSEQSNQPASSRRAKLDLGAGRRLLFGALGIKTPKTKKDEEKVRSDLMKDVRPTIVAKAPEEHELIANDQAEAGGSEEWRENIIYRGVECVQEDVELSEPLFPFVQRWDPQQQNSWSQKGKRKKDQRDQSQYYDKNPRASKKVKLQMGKYNYADEQEYLDASYEPSHQEDKTVTEYEEPSQMTNHQSDDFEGEINQSLDNIKVPYAGFSQNPGDLAPLPEDITTLASLENGGAKVGMTIAFKQLEMSASTRWQPQISAYRTAIVIAIPRNDELHLTLAMRDRKQSGKSFDEETGERIYNKFDMPESDDDMEEGDDGMLNLSFGELVEARIVQEAPEDLDNGGATTEELQARDIAIRGRSDVKYAPAPDNFVTLNEEESAEAQFSHITETPVDSNAPEPEQLDETPEQISEVSQDIIVKKYVPGHCNTPAIKRNNLDPATPLLKNGNSLTADQSALLEQISDEAKQKISHIIKDAGLRSSVPSSITKDIRPDGMATPGDVTILENLLREMTEEEYCSAYSPKFNGFGYSSPTNRCESLQPTSRKQRKGSNSVVGAQSISVALDPRDENPSSVSKEQEQDTSIWVTDPEDEENAVPSPTKQNFKRKQQPPKKVPVSRAQEMWEALQPKSRRTSYSSASESAKTSPDRNLGPDGDGGRDTIATIQYPQLTVGSSFTSQITDHGHQPDFGFAESAAMNVGNSKAPEYEMEMPLNTTLQLSVEPELPCNPAETAMNIDRPNTEPDLPPRKSDSERISGRFDALLESPKNVAVMSTLPFSDDPFPTLEEVFSQRTTKVEIKSPAASNSHTTEDEAYKEVMAVVDELSGNSNQSTPKASKKRSRHSQSRSLKSRVAKAHLSMPTVSQSRISEGLRASLPSASQSQFAIPQGSQVMDLTMSSEAEPEPEDAERKESISAELNKFNRYGDDDSNDGDYNGDGGWAKKKASTLDGVESRRKTGNGLKNSSQASLNSKNRRKTAPRL